MENLCNKETQLQALLKVYKALIFQRVYSNIHKSAIMHYLAVLGIDKEIYCLYIGNNYSYILAGIVYYVQVLGAEILLLSA
jgi:CTP:phosphocholine cytidylyltransferase-like protein